MTPQNRKSHQASILLWKFVYRIVRIEHRQVKYQYQFIKEHRIHKCINIQKLILCFIILFNMIILFCRKNYWRIIMEEMWVRRGLCIRRWRVGIVWSIGVGVKWIGRSSISSVTHGIYENVPSIPSLPILLYIQFIYQYIHKYAKTRIAHLHNSNNPNSPSLNLLKPTLQ